MREVRTINNVMLDVKHVGDNIYNNASQVVRRVKSLDDCYKRPSESKQQIYKAWQEWALDVKGLYTFAIDTYNTNIFTLSGVIECPNGTVEIVHITPTKHILYTV